MTGAHRVEVIAEAGVNHNGDMDMAVRLIDAAAAAGADTVKFQTFKAESLVARDAPKADYQRQTTDGAESQLDMLRKLELSESDHRTLMARAAERDLAFLSTPFHESSVDLLATLGARRLKIPSGEVTNGPLLLKAARAGLPIILSTGMATLGEVEAALGVLAFGYAMPEDAAPSPAAFAAAYASEKGRADLAKNVILLHCTTEYPAPFADVNLRAMETMASTFGVPVGYSDHTPGITVPVAAATIGAVVIEKHFTLDRTFPGPDHRASLEPDEFAEMVNGIRIVEQALGNGVKEPAESELKNMAIARKSLVAATDIKKGDRFSAKNVTVKRPGTGLSPMSYWDRLGTVADRDIKADQVI